MKSKKSFFLLFNIIFLSVYILSVSFFYNNVYEEEKSDFYNQQYEVHNLTRILAFDYMSSDGATLSMDDVIDKVGDLDSSYPTLAAFYNHEGEMVKILESSICFIDEDGATRFIDIDKYITDDMRQAFMILHPSGGCGGLFFYHISEIKYTTENDELIPVSVTVESEDIENRGERTEFKFTDYENYKTVLPPDPEYPGCGSFLFIDLDKSLHEHKLYEKIRKRFDDYKKISKEHFLYKDPTYFGETKEYELFAHDKNNFAFDSAYAELKDGNYMIAIMSYTDLFYNTINNDVFISMFKNFTVIFFAIYFILLFIIINVIKTAERNEKVKTAFTSAAAHELKTPLSVIENQCECIMENVAPDKNEEYVNSIYSESLRMNKLVASLLQYNRLATANKIRKEEKDLSEILNSEIEKYSRLITDKKIHFETVIHNSCKVKCNKELIALVIDNFLSNANKHTESGNKIKVELKKQGKKYRVSVYNEGKNIPDKELKNIWNLLNKTDKSRNRDDNSTGMGLTICREILKHHKYAYGVFNKKNGVEFYFTAK